jgi:U4/U6 small nuclear ribonucleoprotein PRP31
MEATSYTLADALLDDLDDLSDVEDQPTEEGKDGDQNSLEPTEDDNISGGDMALPKSSTAVGDGKAVPRFLENQSLQKHMVTIREVQPSGTSSTKEEREQEHQLIVLSNKYLASLAEELARTHGQLCEAYEPKFPELEEIIPNPVQYTKAVRVIGNEMDMTRVNDALNEFLASNQIITLSVAGSTTSGRLLTGSELETIGMIASYIEDIIKVQDKLTQFIERRMEGLAPSVCALIGSSVAARLVGLAGGLAELSKIPACNLQVLGQVRQNSTSRAGLSAVHSKPHQGVLSECDLVKRCPQHLQKKALKTVAAKLALAARCDFVNVDTGRSRSAASGSLFRMEIEAKVEKWQEPDKAPTLKALPK